MYEIINYKNKIFCCNCGKYGHKYSQCIDPITSLGIIAIKIKDNVKFDKVYKYLNNVNNVNILNSNNINNNILFNIKNYINNFEILMIRRKKTLGYFEFMRGRYDENNMESYTILFEQMIEDEINDIKNNDFDILWNDLWKKRNDNKYHKLEYEITKKKFNYVKSNKFDIVINNIILKHSYPEWGFPKGRRNYLEKNINCAKREFEEETSLTSDNYILINNITPLHEIFYGTNNILYKHIYYIALCNSDTNVKINEDNIIQLQEIGDINFMEYKECKNKIRYYHNEKKRLLNEICLYICSIMYNLDNNN